MSINVQPSTIKTDLVKYFPDGSAMILLDNIITPHKMVYPESVYILKERQYYNVVRVKEIWNDMDAVNLKVQSQDHRGRIYTVGHALDPENAYFMWYLYELEGVLRILEERVMMSLIVGKTV